MGSLRRKSRIYHYRYRLEGRAKEVSLETTDPRIARSRAKEIEGQVTTGKLQLSRDVTVDEAQETFIRHLFATRTRKSAKADAGRLRIWPAPVLCTTLKVTYPLPALFSEGA